MSKNDGGSAMTLDLESLRGHTPGPWYVRYCDDDAFMCMTAISAVPVPERNVDLYDERDPEQMVAIVYHQHPPFVRPEDVEGAEANARLIAAAPELLAELAARRARDAEVEALVAAAKRANGDHTAPHDCYATGPSTGDDYLDLVSCPGCELAAALLPFTGDKT